MLTPHFPNLGIGIGLRQEHFAEIKTNEPDIDWFEIISEQFIEADRKTIDFLDWALERYPIVMHGVALAIGSPGPIDFDYLAKLKKLSKKTKTPWFSDHLCWGRVPEAHFHDLLPLPQTKEVINYVVPRLKIVQDYMEIPMAIENLSSYISYNQSDMSEWEFYNEVIEQAGVYMMLDVNNIYVSSRNVGFDPLDFCRGLSYDRIIQIHLAGHTDKGDIVIDTHDNYVRDEVWKLYKEIYPLTRGVSTLLEWDDHFLSFEATWKEALKAKEYQKCLKYQLV